MMNVEQPLVSVVVPVYNGQQCIQACMDSILTQSLTSLEIIVVDDGSTDGTWAIVSRIAKQDARVRPLRQKNAGVSEARNAALPLCRGRYIRFVDADDLLPPDSMARLTAIAERDGSDLVLAGYYETVGSLRTTRGLIREEKSMPVNDYLRFLSKWSNTFYCGVLWNKLFRAELIHRQGTRFVSGLRWGEDFSFVCDYLTGAERVSVTAEPVYVYQRNAKGATVHMTLEAVAHPFASCRVKYSIYKTYRDLYVHRGQYDAYRRVLWRYLFRATLKN